MSSDSLEALRTDAAALLARNRRVSRGFRYTVPSPRTYPYQWLWDSCFHAIVLTEFDVDAAKDELRSLITAQQENGMIPHMVYWERGDVINFDWGVEGISSITQPPMLAYALWTVYQKTGDHSLLAEIYPAIQKFHDYLLRDRDPRGNNLAGIINPDESGEDNSPRFDYLLDLPPVHEWGENMRRRLELVAQNKVCNFDAAKCMRNFFWVKDVPFNAILAENLGIEGLIAEVLGERDAAQRAYDRRKDIARAMRVRMYEDGLYWSTYGPEYERIKVKTWHIFSPLFAGLLSPEEAGRLVENHLKNPDEFWSVYPIPTVAKDEPSYQPAEMWRGPTWIGINWFVYQGLMRYGFIEEAAHIKDRSAALIELSGFREYFHPDTGEGHGAEDFTWNTLVFDMNGRVEFTRNLENLSIVTPAPAPLTK